MTINRATIGLCIKFACIITMACLFSMTAHAAFLYKSYIVRKDRGKDILCDPYIVQKDDYVLKIFRQRGEISHDNFPTFLRIFGRINPHVHNIDKILPGQHIFIPLKILAPGSLEGQELGVVTIPFVTISDIHSILKNNSKKYTIDKGDTVSDILSSNFGRYGTKTYEDGLRMFKAMNPQIENLNLIYAGQEVFLPQKALQNQPWYESLFDASGDLVKALKTETDTMEKNPTDVMAESTQIGKPTDVSSLEQVAQILDAKLFQKGVYYFPRLGQKDFQLDLTRFPVLEMGSRTRVLVMPPPGEGKRLSETNLVAIKNYWKSLSVISLSPNAPFESALSSVIGATDKNRSAGKHVFTDQGVQVMVQAQWMIDQPQKKRNLGISVLNEGEERTPQPIIDYLMNHGILLKELSSDNKNTHPSPKTIAAGGIQILDASVDPKTFIQNFFSSLGINYAQNVSVSFPYAGAQIQAVSNLLSKPNGGASLIDFGDLYGDAVQAIEKTGIKVVQIEKGIPIDTFIPKLITAAGMTCNIDPTFSVARRKGSFNTSITVPGYLAQQNEKPTALLATAPLDAILLDFFLRQEIRVIGLSGIRREENPKPASL
jgi:hypothetical protein